jgi:hypothetical protein
MRGVTHLFRFAVVTGVALAVAPIAVAQAQPPPNDTIAGATAITGLPFTTTEDTTQATLDSADTAAATACSTAGFPPGPTFSNSVWFAYTPTSNQQVGIDTSASNYGVAGAVLTGTPASFTAVTCFLGNTNFSASAGTTYYIDLVESPAGTGGTLGLSVTQLQPPNPVLTVDSTGTFDSKSGTATVTGTASCTAGAFGFVDGSLTQSVGRIATITGFGSTINPPVCDGTAHPWSLVVTPSSGKFKGGHATASVFMGACSYTCASQQVTQTIQLKGR